MKEINFIKSITILGATFKMKYDKTHDGGSVNVDPQIIEIGTKGYEYDPHYTISTISHEVMESILYFMGARFQNSRTQDCYLFNFDHQTFETAIQIHSEIMLKFIK
jgi:UDP-N-acetyl-D-mannosaminuronate dehydrogenase